MTETMAHLFLFLTGALLMLSSVCGWQTATKLNENLLKRAKTTTNLNNQNNVRLYMSDSSDEEWMNRRTATLSLFTTTVIGGSSLLVGKEAALAQPQEFGSIGTQAPPPDGDNPFVLLDNGVKYKEYKSGSGAEVVQSNSNVFIQCTGRLLNLNGVVFYSTKANNNADGFGPKPLVLTLGKGEVLPGLESAMIGMKRGAIRRIIVPENLAYSAFPNLEPKPVTDVDKRALDSVIKNPRRDATILFDVSVERIK